MARYVPPAFKDGLEFDVIDCAAHTPYAFPNMRVEYVRVEPPPAIQTAFWRGVGLTHNVFVVETSSMNWPTQRSRIRFCTARRTRPTRERSPS